MSPSPSSETAEGRVYNELRKLAKRKQRNPAEYFTLYALEGFLVRLARNEGVGELVLKGGLLMAAFTERRPTRDIDLAAAGFPNSIEACEERVRAIAATGIRDGLDFDVKTVRGEVIRDDADYSGIRVHIRAHLATADIPIHIDMSFGDPIHPLPLPTAIPLLFGGRLDVLAYPITMLLAEKLITAIDRGMANTRWRDFLDVLAIIDSQTVSGSDLSASFDVVAAYRMVEPRPLAILLAGMGSSVQAKWTVWRRKQHLEDFAPEVFQDVLDRLVLFADPVIDGKAKDLSWNPEARHWERPVNT